MGRWSGSGWEGTEEGSRAVARATRVLRRSTGTGTDTGTDTGRMPRSDGPVKRENAKWLHKRNGSAPEKTKSEPSENSPQSYPTTCRAAKEAEAA